MLNSDILLTDFYQKHVISDEKAQSTHLQHINQQYRSILNMLTREFSHLGR
jgi:hypothetical protein